MRIGIVHIGLGAFHRAHEADYLQRWLNRNGGGDWGICAANIRSNSKLVGQLEAQGCRYHIAAFADRDHVRVSEIDAIRQALFAGNDPAELLEAMTSPSTKIVSLTVTEKGYYQSPATGELLLDDPALRHDLNRPRTPRTAPGILLEALRRRRILGIEPFTVLCCDNMPGNGFRVQHAVSALAERVAPEIARWIAEVVAFPSTMVDRIVPAMTPEMAQRLEILIGHRDPVAVACEAFSQWVVEDRFPLGRPDWEADGVEMVADATPYETRKIRLLNGAHSLLAYVGLRRGYATVAEAVNDPGLSGLVTAYFDEAAATLDGAADIDTVAYQESLMARFRNNALEHRLRQIAMDGSQKLPQRWLAGAAINLDRRLPISATAKAVAAWMHYVRGTDGDGNRWEVDDPLAMRLADCHRENGAAAVVDAILAIRTIFPERLAVSKDFRKAVLGAFRET